ncbi:MAG: STAS domain-containing protein [Thermodesulfobacteriota bacterium]
MPFATRVTGDEAVLVLTGTCTRGEMPALRDELLRLRHQGLVLDLAGVTSLDTAFLQLVCAAGQTWTQDGCAFQLSGLSPELAQLVRLSGFDLAC